jgi:hypothetical protein
LCKRPAKDPTASQALSSPFAKALPLCSGQTPRGDEAARRTLDSAAALKNTPNLTAVDLAIPAGQAQRFGAKGWSLLRSHLRHLLAPFTTSSQLKRSNFQQSIQGPFWHG